MNVKEQNRLVTQHLRQFITDHKQDFIERVLGERTRYVTLVLEDIYQSQNASAAIRTCECLGLQDIHIIETNSHWKTNKDVLKGSHKWLTMIRYKEKAVNNIETCYHALRQQGYRIAVTDPSPDGVSIDELKLDRPVALVMGNEKNGSSKYALAHADVKVKIPMVGFTESLNISVSAAICLNSVLFRLRKTDLPWGLKEEEKEMLRLEWYKKVVRRSDVVEREFLRSIQ